MTLGDLERTVWKQIQQATEKRQSARLARLGLLADEMETKRKEWSARLANPLDASPIVQRTPTPPDGDFTGRPIRAFCFEGTEVSVSTYKELLLRLANVLRQKHDREFDRAALSLGGRKRRYFSTDSSKLKYAHELDGGGLFAETNLNANLVVKICYDMLQALGHERGTLILRS